MTWPIVLTAMGTLGSILLGYLGLRRSSKADQALNTATLVQVAFAGTKDLVDRLQADIARYARELDEQSKALRQCEDQCRDATSRADRLSDELVETREALIGMRATIRDQQRELDELRRRQT